MKKLIWVAAVLIILFAIALNFSMVADQAVTWVKEHPKDPDAPVVLYRTARACDILGNDDKAGEIYWYLYQQYPERGELCAPALYYLAYDKSNNTYITEIKKQANTYLEIIMNQYSTQSEWSTKAKKLYDEVNYVR